MNAVVLGAGIGAILLSILWTIALIFCFISLRTRYNVGPIVICVAIFITFGLLSVPRRSDVVPSMTKEKVNIIYPIIHQLFPEDFLTSEKNVISNNISLDKSSVVLRSNF